MIRGPVLPQLRASLWAQMARRLDSLERGLTLVLQGVDCSAGQFGLVEGLARDAMGAPVLVLVAVDGDGLLTARAHAACEFLARIGDALPTAVPEANLVAGARGRVLVLGTDAGAGSLDLLRRLPLPGLEVCRLETFRIAGSERLAVRWLDVDGPGRVVQGAAPGARSPEFDVPSPRRQAWDELRRLCERIDPGIAWDGDRFSRRITWQGRVLGRVTVVAGELWGFDVCDGRHALQGAGEIHRFVDLLLRRYSCLTGLIAEVAGSEVGGGDDDGRGPIPASDDEAVGDADPVSRTGSSPSRPASVDSLRATLSTARLSAEEYSALGEPTAVSPSDGDPGDSRSDDVARIVTAQSVPWHAQRRTD